VTPTQQAEAPELGARYTGNVRSLFKRTVINIMEPTPDSMRGAPVCHALLHHKVYINPNQEALTVVNTLMINFFCCFRVLRELHSNQGQNIES
jgi:hypothetical protein